MDLKKELVVEIEVVDTKNHSDEVTINSLEGLFLSTVLPGHLRDGPATSKKAGYAPDQHISFVSHHHHHISIVLTPSPPHFV